LLNFTALLEKYLHYERKITPKWIGGIIRRKLNIKTEKGRTHFLIPMSELGKLERLYEKYGIIEDNSAQIMHEEDS
jgi:hypothetical protein